MKKKSSMYAAKPTFSCGKCGSRNTKIYKAGGILEAFMKKILPQPLRGQVRVRCRDCGHKMLLMLN